MQTIFLILIFATFMRDSNEEATHKSNPFSKQGLKHNKKIDSDKLSVKNGKFLYCKNENICSHIKDLVIQDAMVTDANCSSTLEVDMFVKDATGNVSIAFGYLNKYGSILNEPGNGMDCSRSKIFKINDTHCILTFGSIHNIIHNTDIDLTLLNILWHHDKYTYFLFYLGYYNEIKSTYNQTKIIKVTFFGLNTIIFLKLYLIFSFLGYVFNALFTYPFFDFKVDISNSENIINFKLLYYV